MDRLRIVVAALAVCAAAQAPARAADLVWEVESPFRLFKQSGSFALHEAAYRQVRGDVNSPIPADIVWRTERRLNDPDCRDHSTPDRCAATRGPRYEQSRLGWAAQTLPAVCYDSNGNPRRYLSVCERRYSWGTAKEDYILPDAHTVQIGLAPEHKVAGVCEWTWQPRKPGGKAESRKLPCEAKLTIARVPYSLDHALSGVAVTVRLPDGRDLAETVMVEDVLVAALGDSFASGESNPDRPVTFSTGRQMLYDPTMNRPEQLAARQPAQETMYGIASVGGGDPRVLPRRLLEDEEKALSYATGSREFEQAFAKRNARWFSADCHRSQYGYPFRVGLQLALENRHRAVTLVSLACSGADVAEGLFFDMASRDGSAKVRAQLDQLSDLICRTGAAGRTQPATYALPLFQSGDTRIEMRNVAQRWCPPQQRKRPLDLVLLSIGGNDVGFGALVLYGMTENASDVAPIAGLIGRQIRFAPNVSRAYLNVLDRRLKAVKDALRDGFGVEPARVVQNGYEPLQSDETGAVCGTQPTLGMDVHPKFKLDRQRLTEIGGFFKDFVAKLECTSSTARRPDCPAGLATGSGTGFMLVTEHQPQFAKRGICARNPQAQFADGLAMQMPRMPSPDGAFKPFAPSSMLPYAARWRLFRTPNDAFLIANSHAANISIFDILQPAYVGLHSGAAHPTAEGHAIVADAMMRHARGVLSRRDEPMPVTSRAVTTGVR